MYSLEDAEEFTRRQVYRNLKERIIKGITEKVQDINNYDCEELTPPWGYDEEYDNYVLELLKKAAEIATGIITDTLEG